MKKILMAGALLVAMSVAAVAQTPAPVTVIHGGEFASQVVNWLSIAFGTALAGLGTLVLVRIRSYFGIQTTAAQKAVLQEMAVNAVNGAAAKASTALKNNPNLDINVKDAVVADAVSYVQNHGADTIKALGLDPRSGDAVEAIKARIETALNSADTPTVTATAVVPTPPAKVV